MNIFVLNRFQMLDLGWQVTLRTLWPETWKHCGLKVQIRFGLNDTESLTGVHYEVMIYIGEWT